MTGRSRPKVTFTRGFLLAQGSAIVQNDISDGDIHAGTCVTPHTCQFGFYWGLPIAPGASSLGATVGTQTSALDALVAALPPAP